MWVAQSKPRSTTGISRILVWMDEILHHLRNPGRIRFPCKYQQTMVSHGFLGGAGFRPSTVRQGRFGFFDFFSFEIPDQALGVRECEFNGLRLEKNRWSPGDSKLFPKAHLWGSGFVGFGDHSDRGPGNFPRLGVAEIAPTQTDFCRASLSNLKGIQDTYLDDQPWK